MITGRQCYLTISMKLLHVDQIQQQAMCITTIHPTEYMATSIENLWKATMVI